MSTRCRAAALCALALLPARGHGAPYLPQRGDEVVEVLARRDHPLQSALRGLRAQWRAHPRDLALATGLAQRYIEAARSLADPRYLGYAEAALAPWWPLAAPPPAVRLLRATLRQSGHQFQLALADLDAVVAAEPANAQAWLTRATILTVQGDYARAGASCARLSSLAGELVAVACLAAGAAMGPRAAQAERLLERTLERAANAPPALQVWALTLLADMAARRADAGAAEARFRRARALGPDDHYLLGAYADFLLDQGRPAAVLALLRDQGRVDALLLRHALALRQTAGAQAALATELAELEARFNAAARRGEPVHQREQARCALWLRGDAAAALALARANWAVQREAADIRIYLEAALAARAPGAAAPVLDWVRANGVQDAAVARLARQLGAGP